MPDSERQLLSIFPHVYNLGVGWAMWYMCVCKVEREKKKPETKPMKRRKICKRKKRSEKESMEYV